MTVMAPMAPQTAMQLPPPVAIPPNVQQIPAPTVNVYAPQQQPMGWTRYPPQGTQREKRQA